MQDHNTHIDPKKIALQPEVNQVIKQLSEEQSVEVAVLAERYPAFNTLLQKLQKRKIISLVNGLATPRKPKVLKKLAEYESIESCFAWLHLEEKYIKTKHNKKINMLSMKKKMNWVLTIVAVSIITFFVKFLLEEYVNTKTKEDPLLHQFTVFVTDINGNVVLEHQGKVNTFLGNRPLRGTIGEDGRVNFGDLQKSYIGDTIQLGFKAEGWRLVHPDSMYVFNGKPIKLKIRRDLGSIKGIVKSLKTGEYLPGAEVRINTDTIIYTDSTGVFKIDLPLKYQVPDLHHRYKLEASAQGYISDSQYYQPLSNPADFRLKKNKNGLE
jgi:hypothetical protein